MVPGAFPFRLSRGGSRGVNHFRWREGQNDPEHEVEDQTRPAAKNQQQPNHADNCGIKVEIIRNPGANAADFLVRARTHESPPTHRAMGQARSSAFRLFRAAVVAKLRACHDLFLTIWTRYHATPAGGIPPFPTLGYETGSQKVSFCAEPFPNSSIQAVV